MHLIARLMAFAVIAFTALPATSSAAEMRGVTSTEIRIGQTMPYSGPVSAFGALGKGEVGFSRWSTSAAASRPQGQSDSLDDGYAPPKTVEQTRRLVESDEVAPIFSSIGTAHNTAIARYLRRRGSPVWKLRRLPKSCSPASANSEVVALASVKVAASNTNLSLPGPPVHPRRSGQQRTARALRTSGGGNKLTASELFHFTNGVSKSLWQLKRRICNHTMNK
jgi:hypothetical protein